MSRLAWVLAPAWIALGLGLYLVYGKRHGATTEDEILEFERAEAPRGPGFRVMVPVANPDKALELVQTTYKICGAKQARVELLHMVPVPPQVPLADAGPYMLAGKEGILETMLYLGPQFPLSTHVRYCRNVARGIVSAARERKVNLLILGWHGRGRGGLFHLGSTIDPVLERAPCDVAILKNCGGNRSFRRVLVPVAGGPNSELALELASILADDEDGRVVAFTVGAPRGFNPGQFIAANQARLHLPADRIEAKVVGEQDAAEAILRESEDYDLLVLGSTGEAKLRRMTRDPMPEAVAKRCQRPLVMVRAARGPRSWIRRWI
jgi:nucleotide-binding universal stress UspA family protein